MRAQGPRFENCMSGPKSWKLRSAGHHAGTGGALETVCLMSGYLLYDSDTAGRRSSRKGLSACEPLLLEFAPAPIASYRCCCASTCVITSSELGLPAALASVMPMKEGCAAKAAKRADRKRCGPHGSRCYPSAATLPHHCPLERENAASSNCKPRRTGTGCKVSKAGC